MVEIALPRRAENPEEASKDGQERISDQGVRGRRISRAAFDACILLAQEELTVDPLRKINFSQSQ